VLTPNVSAAPHTSASRVVGQDLAAEWPRSTVDLQPGASGPSLAPGCCATTQPWRPLKRCRAPQQGHPPRWGALRGRSPLSKDEVECGHPRPSPSIAQPARSGGGKGAEAGAVSSGPLHRRITAAPDRVCHADGRRVCDSPQTSLSLLARTPLRGSSRPQRHPATAFEIAAISALRLVPARRR